MNRLNLLLCSLLLTCAAAQAFVASQLWLPSPSVSPESSAIFDNIDSSPTTDEIRNILNIPDLQNHTVNISLNGSKDLGNDGFVIVSNPNHINIIATSEIGALYGAFSLVRIVRANHTIPEYHKGIPQYDLRILNHWDNLDGSVERGYAGSSLWNWDELPDSISPRYKQYARANASIGINGSVINNVNASPGILSAKYLVKAKTLADIFRPFGIKLYLSVNFASPMALDSLPTADPLNPDVQNWWKNKVAEIYRLIPDFGGFLVKANSEGQPGPMDFGRSHADGANMLANAIKPYGGIIMWRAFVYSSTENDRAKEAFCEFSPLDGEFEPNVILQVKNGPIDFQPREPYSPLFGALHNTPEMVEFQITQEYLGHANHLAYLAPMWKEFFEYVSPNTINGVAGVANIGDNENWTGNPLAQANWYAFGRLAWNPNLSSRQIIEEWLANTLVDNSMPTDIREELISMFLTSRESVVEYMMPLGLHHLFAFGHHYGPEPWCDVEGAIPEWLPKYYHRADSVGLGFDRTANGSNAVSQYPKPFQSVLSDIKTCPDKFLLWFHHVPWTYRMKSGRTLWDELCISYQNGCDMTIEYQRIWDKAKPYLPEDVYDDVHTRLITQTRDAQWWKDACLLYFQTFSNLPFPDEIDPPIHNLEDLKNIHLPISNFESPSPSLLNSLR